MNLKRGVYSTKSRNIRENTNYQFAGSECNSNNIDDVVNGNCIYGDMLFEGGHKGTCKSAYSGKY